MSTGLSCEDDELPNRSTDNHFTTAPSQFNTTTEQQQVSNNPTTEPQSLDLTTASTTPLEHRFLFDGSFIPALIGKGGSFIQSLRDSSACSVHVKKTENRDVSVAKAMTVKGSIQQTLDVIEMVVNKMLSDSTSPTPPSSATIRLLVHQPLVGALIGKGGEIVKSMIAETQCNIKIAPDTLFTSSERTVTLNGTLEQILTALKRCLTILSETPQRDMHRYVAYEPEMVSGGAGMSSRADSHRDGPLASMMYPTMMSQQMMPFMMPFGLTTSNDPRSMQQPEMTQRIAIPTSCAGSVIGKQGSVLARIRQMSQCRIQLDKATAEMPDERVVTITGQMNGIQHAIHLIREAVERGAQRNASSPHERTNTTMMMNTSENAGQPRRRGRSRSRSPENRQTADRDRSRSR